MQAVDHAAARSAPKPTKRLKRQKPKPPSGRKSSSKPSPELRRLLAASGARSVTELAIALLGEGNQSPW